LKVAPVVARRLLAHVARAIESWRWGSQRIEATASGSNWERIGGVWWFPLQ